MKSKKILVGCALLCVIALSCVFVACSNEFKYEPTNEQYQTNFGWSFPECEHDSEINLDGIPSDDAFKAQKWYKGKKISGTETADINFTTYFGEKGIYLAFDVEEQNAHIYYNPDRPWLYNSGIECFMALEGTEDLEAITSFRIDMQCSGYYNFTQRLNGEFVDVLSTHEINPVYKVKTKGGAYNTDECYGYSGEMFIPYTFFRHLDVLGDTETIKEIYVNPVLNTSYNFDGDTENDRHWYNTASFDTDGDGWGKPVKNFHFDEHGLKSHKITVDCGDGGSVAVPKNYDFAIDNNSLTLDLFAEEGYTLKTLTVNDENYKDKITFENFQAKLKFLRVTEDLNIKAEFEKIDGELCKISGNIVPEGVNANKGLSDMKVKYFDGFKYCDLRTVDGSYTGKIAKGEYDIVVYSQKDGYEVTSKHIDLNKDLQVEPIIVDDSMYGDLRTYKFDGTAFYIDWRTLALPGTVTADKFVFSFWFGLVGPGKIDEQDRFVNNLEINAGTAGNIRLQLVRWDGNDSVAILLPNAAHYGELKDNLSGVDEALKRDNGLKITIVKDGNNLKVYAVDKDGERQQLLDINMGSHLSDALVFDSLTVYDADGRGMDYGVLLKDCVIIQSCADISKLGN